MHEICNHEKCHGCKLCESICPCDCIVMRVDEAGFVYPRIDISKCINCGKCKVVCPANNFSQKKGNKFYVGYAIEKNVRASGSSGGIFGAFAKYIIKQNGIVYGAGFNGDLQLTWMKAECMSELEPLYRSKYIQCDMSGCYEDVKAGLETGRQVLFCSAPCNCQALKNYLNHTYENLILMDFVCHGVSSQKLFDKSVSYVVKKGYCVDSFDFRSKEHKLNCSRVFCFQDKNKHRFGVYLNFPYYYLYMKYISFRKSCYCCQFATNERCTDITIADYHMPMRYFPNENRLLGASSIIVSSEKAYSVMQDINLRLIEVRESDLIECNSNLQHATYSKKASEFNEDSAKLAFKLLLKKYGYYSMKTNVLRLYYILPIWMQNILRHILIKE